MNVLGLQISWARKSTFTLDQWINRLEAAFATVSNVVVTPETAMESPTVQAIVQAIGTISTLPVSVLRKTASKSGAVKEALPNHPVAKLLSHPSEQQNRVTYWLDASSWLVRYGNHVAVKAQGSTGPIRRLESVPPGCLTVEQQADRSLIYRVTQAGGASREYQSWEVTHARGAARNGYWGDSPVMDVRESIALEIAAERFGSSFFGNGAMPSIIFSYMKESMGHQKDEERKKFLEDFRQAYGNKNRFKAMVLPKGMEWKEIAVENEKAQFLETRKHQRTVIAGAFGVPPHMVGDLERGTFSNIEHQSLEFVQRVLLRYVRIFEASMERDLLTPSDRNGGVIIRFNLDGALRGDFKSRQEGWNIKRMAGVVTPNEWREAEGMNPLPPGQGGDDVYQQGPSGQNQDPKPKSEEDPDDPPAS